MTDVPSLIDPDHPLLGAPGTVVLDATVRLERPAGGGPYRAVAAYDGFLDAHLPGARFADLVSVIGREEDGRPFGIPDVTDAAAALARLGVADGTPVVVYAQEGPMWATRLWWLLRYWGLDDVRVLDGGLTAWRSRGLPVETGEPPAAPVTAPPTLRARPELLARLDDVRAVSEAGGSCLANALGPDVFRGEGVTSYSRPGRIPGSVSAPWASIVDPGTQRFVARDSLQERLAPLLEDARPAPVVYCGGGISATVVVFGLHLLGRDDVRLYDGSLAEWSADPSLPLEVG